MSPRKTLELDDLTSSSVSTHSTPLQNLRRSILNQISQISTLGAVLSLTPWIEESWGLELRMNEATAFGRLESIWLE
jgi:hypothetical protein